MTTRIIYFFSFLLTALLLSCSLYLQFFDNIMPCPLCSLQRMVFCILGLLFFFGIFVHKNYKAKWFLSFACGLFSIIGMILSGRQIWLQHYPSSSANECGVSLQYMVQVLPMNEVIQKIFEGSAECTQRGWEFLSLNMAEWALFWFTIFFGISVYLFIKKTKH